MGMKQAGLETPHSRTTDLWFARAEYVDRTVRLYTRLYRAHLIMPDWALGLGGLESLYRVECADWARRATGELGEEKMRRRPGCRHHRSPITGHRNENVCPGHEANYDPR